jgi:site-specific recombinase XerD
VLAVEGARKSYLMNCESMQRVQVSPRLGTKSIDRVTVADIETVAAAMLAAGRPPKTVHDVITFMHSVFEHAIDRGWTTQNPVRRARRPKRRRTGDATPTSSS